MKKTYLSIIILFIGFQAFTQNKVNEHLAEASTSYAAKDLEATRFALQQSLNELYILIGEKILAEMPEKLGDAAAQKKEDVYNGYALGFTGVYIDRTYQNAKGDQRIEINLINDSPLLAGLNTFLTNPILNIGSGRKMIKIDGYKSALEKSEGEPLTFTLSTPFNQSLITTKFEGFKDENQVLALAKQIPFAKIIAVAQ